MLLDDLRARVPLDGDSRLLDLACGTGQVAFALAADVAEVWAIDQEADSIEFATHKAQRLGLTNIHTGSQPQPRTCRSRASSTSSRSATHSSDSTVTSSRSVWLATCAKPAVSRRSEAGHRGTVTACGSTSSARRAQ